MELRIIIFASLVVSAVSSPIQFKQHRSGYEYNKHTNAFYKLHTVGASNMPASEKCIEEGAEHLTIFSLDEEVKQVQDMLKKLLGLAGLYKPGETGNVPTDAFVCKVAARNVPYNKECGVFSNDYESKISSTGSCYRVSTTEVTWSEAHASCEADGAHLVILNNAKELEVLYNMLNAKPHDSETQYFAGVRADMATPQDFKTVLNQTLEEVGYGPWEAEEPNNWHNSGENCVVMDTRRHGKYNDVPCYDLMRYVCESSPEVVITPSTTTSAPVDAVVTAVPSKKYRPDYEYNKNTDAFYKLHTKVDRKTRASRTCQREGAELAKMASDEDLKQVQAMMEKLSDLWDNVIVASDDNQFNVVNRQGKIETTRSNRKLPFVCKVAAKDAPYNKDCGVYSNDYESKISTTGSCYRVSTTEVRWSEAHASCEAEGAHLVILNNAKELEVLYNMLNAKPHGSETQYFAGVIADMATPQDFKTVLNQTLEEVGYGPWEAEEPNNWHNSGENCVVMDTRRHGKYNDVSCYELMRYVCESSPEVVITPSTTTSAPVDAVVTAVPSKKYRPDYEYNKNTDAFYKLHTKGERKTRASRTCQREGAELAKMASDEDLKQVQAMMEKLSDLGDYVIVASDDNQFNVVNRKGKIETRSSNQALPFVCKVAAKDAPYNKDCGVYSNDYESKISSTGSCYRVSTTEVTWSEAHASCEADGAHLVILNNAKELEVLYNMLNAKPHDSETQYFAGVRADMATPQNFKTVLNQTLEEVGYGPWEAEEPNNWHNSGENCVVMDTRRHGKYNDVPCYDLMRYVCESSAAPAEINAPPSSTPSSVSDHTASPLPSKQYRPGYEYNENTDAFYKLHTENVQKYTASKKCTEEGAELAKITSDEDLKQIHAMMKKLSDLEDYVLIASKENSDSESQVVNRKGKIETTSSNQALPFVCKVAFKDAPYNKDCGVYSNDYVSKISTTGSCYRISTVPATWKDAYASCQADGAHLVILSDAKELELLFSILQDKPHDSETQYFAGVRADTTTEPRVFKTVLNQTLEQVGYGPWEEEEPNDWHGGENCVVLDTRRHGKYNDVWCHVEMPYVCESPVTAPLEMRVPPNEPRSDVVQVPDPVFSAGPSKQYRPGYEYNEKTDAFYKLHTNSNGRRSGESKCSAEGAELIQITSDEEIKQVQAMKKKYLDPEARVMVASGVYKGRGSFVDAECNVVDSNGEIDSEIDFHHRPFVCKVAAKDTPPFNAECGVYSDAYESRMSITGSCYRVSTKSATWDQANAICQSEGAHLVILSDDTELEMLYDMLQDKMLDPDWQFLAGVKAVTTTEPRLFITVFNQSLEEVGYGPWEVDEPDDFQNWKGGQDCVALDTRRNGKYNDVFCEQYFPYVCETSAAPLEVPAPPSTPSSDIEQVSVPPHLAQSKRYRPDYVYNENTDAFYKLHTVGARKADASRTCIAEGAELVNIISDEDSKQILALMKQLSYGEEYVMVTLSANSVYASRNDFQCNVMNRRGKIETTSAHQVLPFVCKVAAKDAPYNDECDVFSNDYESKISTTGSCYRVSTVQATWNEANANCQAEGAHLVILSRPEELEVLYYMLQDKPHDYGTQYFAGVRADITTEPRVFKTVLNQTLEQVGYGPWEEEEPNNYEGGENCVALDMHRHGKYNDVWCHVRKPYVCERHISEVSDPVSSPLPSKQYRPDYEYDKNTDAFYKLHTKRVIKGVATDICTEEGAELAKVTSYGDLKQILAMMKRIPDLDPVMFASGVYMGYGSGNDFECNMVNSEGEVKSGNAYDDRPFVCKVTATDAPINKECKVFSNDYESRISTTGSCYRVSTEPTYWEYAQAICQGEGGHLLVLSDAKEHEVLVKLLQKKPYNSQTQFFMGVQADTSTEPRVFKTVFNQTLEEIGYEAWDENEPNNKDGVENCVILDTERHSKYRDVPCYRSMPYICESSVVKIEIQPPSAPNSGSTQTGLSDGAKDVPVIEKCGVNSNDYENRISTTGSCYRISTDSVTWDEAHAICQAEGAHLVILSSAEELYMLVTMLQDKPHNSETQYSAGVRAVTFTEPRVFKTVLNETLEEVGYGAWDEGEPNDWEGGEYCVVLDTRRHGKYNDVPCDERRPYVCESPGVQVKLGGSSPSAPNSGSTQTGLSNGAKDVPVNKKCGVNSNDYESRISTTGSCYRISTDSVTWDEAHAICQAEGAHLVILSSAEELDMLVTMLQNKPHNSETQYSAGVRAVTFTEPRVFKTVLNQTLEEVGYGPWDEGEPNNWEGDNENCVVLDTRRHGKYNDVPCSDRRPYVCESSGVQQKTDLSSNTLDNALENNRY